MYSFLDRVKFKLATSYYYVIARILSVPILLIILFLLSRIPNGKSSLIIYCVMLVGSFINGSVGQAIYQYELLNRSSIILFNFGIAILEFFLIVFVALFNDIYLLYDLEISFFIFSYVFLRVLTIILMNYLYNLNQYIQSINFIFSKLIDLFLVYYISNISDINLNKSVENDEFNIIILLSLLTIILMFFLYYKFKPLILNALIRLPVSLLYMFFSFIFFNNIADILKSNSAFLFRLKGFFDSVAAIVSVTSLKKYLQKKPTLSNFNTIIYLCFIASIITHFYLIIGMIFFSIIAVFSANIYSRTTIVHGVHINSLAWSVSLIISIMVILIDDKYSSLAFSFSEIIPLIVIYFIDLRYKKNV